MLLEDASARDSILSSDLIAQPPKKKPPAPKGSAKTKGKADDRLTLTVVTKTGRTNKFARANKIKIFVLLNADTGRLTPQNSGKPHPNSAWRLNWPMLLAPINSPRGLTNKLWT